MIVMIVRSIKVFLGAPQMVAPPVSVSQMDTGWRFSFTAFSPDGQVWTPPEGASVTLEGKKLDNSYFSYAGTIEDGKALFDITAQMVAIPGPVTCELRFYRNAESLGTANFEMMVEESPTSSLVLSQDEINVLNQLVADAIEDMDERKDAAAASAAAAATSETNAAGSAADALASETAAAASAVNAAACELDAAGSASSAASSAAAAAASESAAAESESQAEGYAASAESAASAASGSESAAAASAAAAGQSRAAAESAAAIAVSASTAAQTSATNAAASEANARASEQSAEASKVSAASSASSASSSASSASGSASTATTAAQTATSKASEATTAASTATSASTAAVSAKTAAEAAQAAAEAVLESIPEDYSELSDDVSDLKSAITKLNAFDILSQFAKPQKSTENITLSWSGDVCTINGVATSVSEANNSYYNNTSALPTGLYAGQKLIIRVNSTSQYANLVIIPYISGVSQGGTYFNKDGEFTVPEGTTGIILRLVLSQNKTFTGVTFEAHIMTALSNLELTRLTGGLQSNLSDHNAVEILRGTSAFDKTHNGVTYTWSDGSVCTVSGTASGASFDNIYSDYTHLPGGIAPGDLVFVAYDTTNPNIRVVCYFYDSSQTLIGTYADDKDFWLTVPSGAVGAIVRLSVSNGRLGTGAARLFLLSAPGNTEIISAFDRISALEARAGASTTAPMLTIIDDDGNELFYTDLYPIAVSKKVPIAAAVPYSNIDAANHVTLEQVVEMYTSGVVEILSHTYGHDTSITGEQNFEVDYRKAKTSYARIGIPCNLIVYAGSTGTRADAREAAARVYDGGIESGSQTINYTSGNKYRIKRYGITDSNADGRINGLVLSELTGLIDTLKSAGGWMIWMLHTSGSYWGDTMKGNIASAIDYALSEGVPVVTAEYGFKTYFGA